MFIKFNFSYGAKISWRLVQKCPRDKTKVAKPPKMAPKKRFCSKRAQNFELFFGRNLFIRTLILSQSAFSHNVTSIGILKWECFEAFRMNQVTLFKRQRVLYLFTQLEIQNVHRLFWKDFPFKWTNSICQMKGLASYCKAETTFTFHFSILTLSNASLGIKNTIGDGGSTAL